jgi:hypothetical protein
MLYVVMCIKGDCGVLKVDVDFWKLLWYVLVVVMIFGSGCAV